MKSQQKDSLTWIRFALTFLGLPEVKLCSGQFFNAVIISLQLLAKRHKYKEKGHVRVWKIILPVG